MAPCCENPQEVPFINIDHFSWGLKSLYLTPVKLIKTSEGPPISPGWNGFWQRTRRRKRYSDRSNSRTQGATTAAAVGIMMNTFLMSGWHMQMQWRCRPAIYHLGIWGRPCREWGVGSGERASRSGSGNGTSSEAVPSSVEWP